MWAQRRQKSSPLAMARPGTCRPGARPELHSLAGWGRSLSPEARAGRVGVLGWESSPHPLTPWPGRRCEVRETSTGFWGRPGSVQVGPADLPQLPSGPHAHVCNTVCVLHGQQTRAEHAVSWLCSPVLQSAPTGAPALTVLQPRLTSVTRRRVWGEQRAESQGGSRESGHWKVELDPAWGAAPAPAPFPEQCQLPCPRPPLPRDLELPESSQPNGTGYFIGTFQKLVEKGPGSLF